MHCPGPASFRSALATCYQVRQDVLPLLAASAFADEYRSVAMHALDSDALVTTLTTLLARQSDWAPVIAGLCADSMQRLADNLPENSWPAERRPSILNASAQLERLGNGWLGTPKDEPTGGPYAA